MAFTDASNTGRANTQ